LNYFGWRHPWYFFFAFTSYKLWRNLLIIQIICWIETEFYIIPVFPHYRVSLAMPGRYSPTFRGTQLRLELFPWGVAEKSNPALVPSDTLTRHTILLTMLTRHTNIDMTSAYSHFEILQWRIWITWIIHSTLLMN
jgi:hypothetical protein